MTPLRSLSLLSSRPLLVAVRRAPEGSSEHPVRMDCWGDSTGRQSPGNTLLPDGVCRAFCRPVLVCCSPDECLMHLLLHRSPLLLEAKAGSLAWAVGR